MAAAHNVVHIVTPCPYETLPPTNGISVLGVSMEDFDREMEKIMARLNSMEDQLMCEKNSHNEHLIDAGSELRQLQPVGVREISCKNASVFATSAPRFLSHLNA